MEAIQSMARNDVDAYEMGNRRHLGKIERHLQ